MADDTQNPPDPSVERQTIREAIALHVAAQQKERIEAERSRRREARDLRAKERQDARISRIRHNKANRIKAANEAQAKVSSDIAAASRSLRAALRHAQEVPFPRMSEEGRQQSRTVRALEDAISALRRIRNYQLDEHNFSIDLDVDVEG